MKIKIYNKSGFSLTELIVVLGMGSLLVSIFSYTIIGMIRTSEDSLANVSINNQVEIVRQYLSKPDICEKKL